MSSIDEDIFEITDFTCVTDWERFVGDLESRIRDWQLHDDSSTSVGGDGKKTTKRVEDDPDKKLPAKLDRLVEQITFGDRTEFRISYVFPKEKQPLASSPSKQQQQQSRKPPTKLSTKSDSTDSKLGHLPTSVRNLLDQGVDFVHESVDMGHHIARYFGLRQFIVMEPSSFASATNILSNDNFITLLTSAVLVATLNTGCDIPVFLQVADQWRWLYNGTCQNINTRTHFEMIHLRNPPSKCCHLSGILEMFKEQVACPITPPPPVKVSLRITYELREAFESYFPSSQIEDTDGAPDQLHGKKDYSRLPFGAVQDTIDKFYLSATWLNLNEDMLVENDVYSDLDPLTAPYWNTTVELSDGGIMLLNEALMNFLKLAGCHKNVDEILGPNTMEPANAASALGRLTNAPLLNDFPMLQQATSKLTLSPLPSPGSIADDRAPLNDATLTRLLQFLFPDADLEQVVDKRTTKLADKGTKGDTDRKNVDNAKKPPGSAISVGAAAKQAKGNEAAEGAPEKKPLIIPSLERDLRRSKTAPNDSLTQRLALVVCQLAHDMQQPRQTVAHLVREFVLELRYRWEHGVQLPGFDGSNPSLADCLLHQKLQMLNCCIMHKLKRQQFHSPTDAKSVDSSTSSRNADEFFDCYEDTAEIDDSVVMKPDGRLRPLASDVFLLENPSELLYIPMTQDPAPVTEDTLEQYGRMLTNMGTTDESAFARAKMQTPSLLSDMEAFKAANPKSIMEDFIRWYSPRDWTEELDRETGQMSGRLSERMSTPGNLWREVWDNARPLPVSRQKRLFDDTTEAEKILLWLYDMQLSELIRLLAPSLFASALLQLDEECVAIKELVREKLESVASQYHQATFRNSSLEYEDLRPQMTDIERMISQYRSLIGRLSSNAVPNEDNDEEGEREIKKFALKLLSDKDIKILGASRGTLGSLFSNMFSKDDRLRFEPKSESSTTRFPPFYSKEYVLRWLVPRPQPSSRECPQRCYVRVKANEFRSAGAFTEDVVFFLPEK